MRRWSELPAWRKLCVFALLAASVVVILRMSTRELADATLVLNFGETGAAIRTIDIELLDPTCDQVLATFKKNVPAGAASVTFPHRGEAGPVKMRARLETTAGVIAYDRTIVMNDGAVVTVNLDDARRL